MSLGPLGSDGHQTWHVYWLCFRGTVCPLLVGLVSEGRDAPLRLHYLTLLAPKKGFPKGL